MAGSIAITKREIVPVDPFGALKAFKVTVDWTGDAVTGAVPSITVPGLSGFLRKVVTVPGSPAPTANYNVALSGPDSSADEALGTIKNQPSANPQINYPASTGTSQSPCLTLDDYTLSVSGNSVASAKGTVILYLTSQP